MNTPRSEICPEEIRAIRKRLRLTQAQAGRLVGGGPRAFAKYEAGILKPAASVLNLLRILEVHPDTIVTLGGSQPRQRPAHGPLPFEIGGDDIERLSPSQLHELLRRLIGVEASAHGLPLYGINVSSEINARDGGEDGRIEWTAGPDHTTFLPARLCVFQSKAGPIEPKIAGQQALKPMVQNVIESEGSYIMFCGKRYTQQCIERREDAIRKAIRGAGIDITDHQIDFRAADQIAAWANHYQAVAMWIKEQTQPGMIGALRSWDHWAGRAEHAAMPWIQDERLDELAPWLQERVRHARSVSRVVGLWGVGKSRLAVQVLGTAVDFVRDLVMYAVESECGGPAIKQVVQNLADSGTRAIVVVDQCGAETHRALAGFASRDTSRLSLITIDDEVPVAPADETTTRIVPEAATSVTEAIIDHVAPGLPFEDRHRLVRFAEGFPAVARETARVWRTLPVAQATDEDLVDSFVLGRNPQEPGLLLKSARLLATFGLLKVELDDEPAQHAEIARLGRDLTAEGLYAMVQRLITRGVAQRRGGFALLRPRPIALNLANRQWNEWFPARWDDVLAGDMRPDLKVSAARQLALLNDCPDAPIATRVVKHLCRPGGPFDGVDRISRAGHARVLSVLAEIDAERVTEQIKRILSDVGDGSEIRRDVGSHLVAALETIAFDSATFEEGARLLLRLALVKNEVWMKNPDRTFRALFPVLLGNTEADGGIRLSALDELRHTDDPHQLAVLATALAAGAKTSHFVRDVGAEISGTRPTRLPWQPATRIEINGYISQCVTWLTEIAMRNDEAGAVARTELATSIRSLIPDGFMDLVETTVPQVAAAVPHWTGALESLGRVLTHPSANLPADVGDRVTKLMSSLSPMDLMTRVRFLISDMPRDYPYEAAPDYETKNRRKVEAVRGLTRELVKQPTLLKGVLPDLCRGRHRMACVFGEALAHTVDSADSWLERILGTVAEAPRESRNYELLAGYLTGLAKRAPHLLETAKDRVARAPELAPALPQVFQRLRAFQEITTSDVALLIDAVAESRLSPLGFGQGFFGAILRSVPPQRTAPLFDVLIDHSPEGFSEAVEMIATYVYGATDLLEEFRPLVRRIAEAVTRWDRIPDVAMVRGCFEEIMHWMLRKGRKERDACATALALARALVESKSEDQRELLAPVVPFLLSDFPEIVWPLFGQAVVSDEARGRRLESLLMNSYGNNHQSALLNLPEHTLLAWCHAHPHRGPAIAARCLPIVRQIHDARNATMRAELHPVTARLVDEFGEQAGFLSAVERNMEDSLWDGSVTDLALYRDLLEALREHQAPKVRAWASGVLRRHGAETTELRKHDEERAARADFS